MSEDKKPSEEKKEKEKSVFKIPLRRIPNEAESLAEEMQEIFDEDKIVHRHGSAEPEHD